ncbi:MAG: 1,4-alpha-glucan branching enzyme, partial [Candidatus Eremiobacteraeota bacterium]|nr:1,4-alpha-glucan branching enzyme [Candidatus Eremiobacteraeota bacterium]
MADSAVKAIVAARSGDPFAILGMHVVDGRVVVRAMLPQASRVDVVDAATGKAVAELPLAHPHGFFAGPVNGRRKPFRYRLRLQVGTSTCTIEDPYRFGTVLGELDLYLFGEGRHRRLYDKLGAHPATIDRVDGVTF